MAFRISELVIGGEIINTKRNRVVGWLAFTAEEGLRLELSGNLEGDLAGKHLRFEVPEALRRPAEPGDREEAEKLQGQQFGVMGSSAFRIFKIPRGSIEDFVRADPENRPRIDEKPGLYLEWFGPNGRVVAEIIDPQIEYGPGEEAEELEPTPLSDEEPGPPEIVGFERNDEGDYDEISFTDRESNLDEDDPYDLFPADLEGQLRESSDDGAEYVDPDEPPPKAEKRPWDEVIPGIDPETKKMYEEWDEVLDGEHDEPVVEMFDPPLSLPPVARVADEAEAEDLLKVLLARLALHSIAVDICEHFTALATYRWLLEEILPEAHIHPRAGASGFVCHYSTFESCPTCEAEFEAEFERREREKREKDEEP